MDFMIDEEFRSRLRVLSEDEAAGLEGLLVENGCLAPLIVWDEENILLDGHSRLGICQRLGIPYEVKRVSFANRSEAMLWVLRHQRDKRNCTDGEKYAMMREIRELLTAQGRQKQAQTLRQNAASVLSPSDKTEECDTARNPGHEANTVLSNIDKTVEHDTRQEIATELGWSAGKVAQADYVWQHGDEKVKDKLIRGVFSVNQAYRDVRKHRQKQQRQAARENPAAQSVAPSDRFRLLTGDLTLAGSEIADHSLDWIVTDPPYPRNYLPVYDALGKFASAKLKPGGSLICMAGQSYLPEITSALTAHLRYHWTLAYLTPGGQAVQLWERKVNAFWKPLLWLTKGDYSGDWIGDVCRSKVNDNDKRFHGWGQSESGMADILERFTKPGDLVCDPFCGGGATGVAAMRLSRIFVGIDIDPGCINATAGRLEAILAEEAHGRQT